MQNSLKAVIHCPQRIPCNPCETSCPFGAIVVGEDISAIPIFYAEKCRGCGLCVAACPGIAIRLLGNADQAGNATVVIPYEYLPVPTDGDTLVLTDEMGADIGEGVLQKTAKPNKHDATILLYITAPAQIAQKTYGIKRLVRA